MVLLPVKMAVCKGPTMAKKYKPYWSISVSRPAVETYSPIEGIRKFEQSPTCNIEITLVDNAGESQKFEIYNIKSEDLVIKE